MLGRVGGWLFRHRTWLPVPIALALFLVPPTRASDVFIWVGGAITAAGEMFRLFAVREIGVISRTRSDRLGPLVATGPFAYTRNPLYVGNIAIWLGFTIAARVIWLIVPVAALLIFEYAAIVRWEEQLLEARLGERYWEYKSRVPRWLPVFNRPVAPDLKVGPTTSRARDLGPSFPPSLAGTQASYGGRTETLAEAGSSGASRYGWRETFFSERGTLIAIAAGFLLLYLKQTL